jgi:hypothetical protein
MVRRTAEGSLSANYKALHKFNGGLFFERQIGISVKVSLRLPNPVTVRLRKSWRKISHICEILVRNEKIMLRSLPRVHLKNIKYP